MIIDFKFIKIKLFIIINAITSTKTVIITISI